MNPVTLVFVIWVLKWHFELYYFILKSSDLHTTAHCRQKLTVMFGPAYKNIYSKENVDMQNV